MPWAVTKRGWEAEKREKTERMDGAGKAQGDVALKAKEVQSRR